MKIKSVILVGMLLTTTAFAQSKKKKSLHDEVTGQNYGMAGCGLGSIVFGDEKGMVQIVAATLNGTGVQTFGITSGTSNCTDGGTVSASKEIPLYIEINKLALAKDAARGEGETLTGLAQLMKCDSKVLGQTLKKNYDQIFVKTSLEPVQIQSEIEQYSSPVCGA